MLRRCSPAGRSPVVMMELSDGKGLTASIEIPAKVLEPPPVPKSRISLEFCMWLQREFDEIVKE